MDATVFLKDRTRLIRFFYDHSAEPFRTMQHQIEKGLPPFDNPPYSEDPEPPYLCEWLDASTSQTLLGHACISMLADTVKLYLNTLAARVIRFRFDSAERKALRSGFVPVFKAALGEILDTDWSDCPASFEVIEQVVLARNRGQHGRDITSFNVRHDPQTLRKHPRPFFATDVEWQTWQEIGGDPDSFFAPSVEVSREALFSAIEQIEQLADYIDRRMDKAWAWKQKASARDSAPGV